MLTLGVDLSAADKRTAMATIEWLSNRAVVRELVLNVGDSRIVEASGHADKVGVDCPLGWPQPFVEFVIAHNSGHVTAADSEGTLWRRRLAYRQTGELVREETRIVPLSVSADRIGHAAFRCAGLLSMLAAAGEDVDRCGDGKGRRSLPGSGLALLGVEPPRLQGPRSACRTR